MRKVGKDSKGKSFWVEGNKRVYPIFPKTKLTEKDFDLINLALSICESDYAITPDNPEPYRVKTLKAIKILRNKLIKLSKEHI